MGDTSRISWTDSTFNPWKGCQHWSEECDHCYADVLAKRMGWDVFGGRSKRQRTGKSIWAKPHTWNRLAAEGHRLPDGRRVRRVFSASIADIFEDAPGPNEWRADFWDVVRACPWLDFQILTKRPENIAEMLPENWGEGWPNVWLGTSIGKRDYVERARVLADIPAFNRFISYEPALGPLFGDSDCDCGVPALDGAGQHAPGCRCLADDLDLDGISWLICGGESGAGWREMDLQWARDARDACMAQRGSRAVELARAGEQPLALRGDGVEGPPTSFFFKQIAAFKNEQGEDALGRIWHEFPPSWDRADVDTHPVFAPEGSLL